jgi:ferredoxin--NADP+ reductase
VDFFDYIPVISRPAQENSPWEGETGHLQDVWRRGVIEKRWGLRPTPQNTHVFLCGNPKMIDATLAMLKIEGFKEQTRKQAGQVHIEKWW